MDGVQELPDVQKQQKIGSLEIEEQLELFAELIVDLIFENEESKTEILNSF